MAIKWQSILTYGSAGTFVLLALLLNLAGMSYSHDGDKFCSDCYSEIRVNSTFWEIKVEHAGDKPIVFKKRTRSRTLWVNLDKIGNLVNSEPEVEIEILKGTISKYATIKNEEYGYLRPLKDGDTLIARNNKNNPYPSRIIIHGKEVTGIVKWGFELNSWLSEDISIDPIWHGINITKICDWQPEEQITKKSITYEYTCPTDYFNFTLNPNIGYCYEMNWNSANNTWFYPLIYSKGFDYGYKLNKTIYWNLMEKVKENISVCDLQGYQINQYKVNFSLCNIYCDRVDKIVSCDSTLDGNGDGILQSGESGFSFDITDANWKNFKKKVDSNKFIKLRDCVVKE